MYLKSLICYPIKSCMGVALNQSKIDSRGLVADRRMMLIDDAGQYVTQRDFPAMAVIQVSMPEGNMVSLEAPGMNPFELDLIQLGRQLKVSVWGDEDLAIDQGEKASQWFSSYLKTKCRLVYTGNDFKRRKTQNGITADLSFADHSPLVICTEESLNQINQVTSSNFAMSRFRPNLVIADCEPFDEYTWSSFMVGTLPVELIRICDRCSIVTVDQIAGLRQCPSLTKLPFMTDEPTRPVFGLHAGPKMTGEVFVADKVQIIERAKSLVSMTAT